MKRNVSRFCIDYILKSQTIFISGVKKKIQFLFTSPHMATRKIFITHVVRIMLTLDSAVPDAPSQRKGNVQRLVGIQVDLTSARGTFLARAMRI